MDWLFDTPWWLPTAGVAGGLVMLYMGNQRQDKKLKLGGASVLLVGVLIALISYLVDTDKEKAVKHTRAIVAAVDKADWAKLKSLIDSDTTFGPLKGAGAFVGVVQHEAETYGLKSVHILSMETEQNDTLISTSFKAFSIQDFTNGQPVTSTWKFSYQKSADGWFLTTIECVEVGGQTWDKIAGRVPRQ
jgi:hypothetical protein